MPRIPSCWRETYRALCSWLLVLAICPLGCLLGKSFGWCFLPFVDKYVECKTDLGIEIVYLP